MDYQLYSILKSSDDKEDAHICNLIMAKKILADDKVAFYSYGYEGGEYSLYCAIYQLDEFSENVIDVIEEHDGNIEDSEYHSIFDDLIDYVSQYVTIDDYGWPSLNEEFIEDVRYDSYELSFNDEWDFDDDVHLTASKNWPFFYDWK